MARKGRKPKSAEQRLRDALDRTAPNERVLERRRLFSWVQPPSKDRLEGRNGEIDSEVCDAIGQFCALGLLDGHGHDPIEMRDKGRFWGGHYARLMKRSAMKIGSAERHSKSTGDTFSLSPADLLFDRLDEGLWREFETKDGIVREALFERNVLLSLIVDPLIGSDPMGRDFSPWCQALIDEGLRARGIFVKCGGFPTEYDRELLNATIRGLVILVDGALPARWAA